jgi:hypothetical protein
MTTKLIDKVVNTEPSGLGFISPSLKPRPEFFRLGTLAKSPTNLNLLFSKKQKEPRSGVDGSNKRSSLSTSNKEDNRTDEHLSYHHPSGHRRF